MQRGILQRYSKKRLLVAAGLMVAGGAIFASIYDGVREHGDLARLDQPILEWAISHRSPELTWMMGAVTNIFSPVGLSIIIFTIAGIWYRRSRDAWHPSLLIGAMAIAFTLSLSIKHLTGRTRPPQIDMIAPFEMDFSFPSGHTLGISVALLVASYLVLSRNTNRKYVALWCGVTVFGIMLVAFSRLYLGYHWLTDVSASVGLALIVLAVIILIDPLRPKRFNQTVSSDTDQ